MINFKLLFDKLGMYESCSILNTDDVSKLDYPFYPQSTVVEIETDITYKSLYQSLTLYISFSPDFPYSIPKVFIKKEFYDTIKYIPHINKDCSICIFDESININFSIGNIEEIVRYIIYLAKKIVKDSENNEYIIKEFNREFKAYWEIKYGKKDLIFNIGLFLIDTDDKSLAKGIKLRKKLFGYEYIVYNEGESWESFKGYLDTNGFKYDQTNIFTIDNSFIAPPYKITFKQSLEILKKNQLYEQFKICVKKVGIDNILIIFYNVVNETKELYGWIYKNIIPLTTIKGTKRKLSDWEMLNNFFFEQNNVLRITFDNLTPKRLQLRSTGMIEDFKSVVVSGLGSVGSNLIYFLKNLPINRFHLIDDDSLELENIYRHYLGFNHINCSKVEGIKEQLIASNPFNKIEIMKKSIQDIIKENPEFINICDFHIVCIGKTMVENYILKALLERRITKPIFIFWVEPYLASGQMLFINPYDTENAIYFLNNNNHDILSSKNNFDMIYLKEGSCQSGYFPYSSTYLIQFLSAIFPYLKAHLIENNKVSTSYTWVGNKEFIESRGLMLSSFASNKNSYDIIITPL